MQRKTGHFRSAVIQTVNRRAMIVASLSLALALPTVTTAQSPTETSTVTATATATMSSSPVATPSTAATASTISNAAADLGEIIWARAVDPATNEPTRRATGFIISDPTIFAVVPVSRIEAGTVVSAAWSFNGIPVPDLDASVTAESRYQDGWISFELAKPEDSIWPTGEYGIVISVNGEAVLESSIMVRVPPA